MHIFRYISFVFILKKNSDKALLNKSFQDTLLQRGIRIITFENNTFTFVMDSILFLKQKGTFHFESNEEDVLVTVKLFTDKILTLIIGGILILAFIAQSSVTAFFTFASFFSIVLYVSNFLLVKNSFFRTLETLIELDEKKGILTEDQKKWIENPNTCSACGTELSVYSYACPECDLQFKEKKDFSRFSVTNKNFKYKYKYKE